jgi:predicted acetyltransferase
MPHLTTPNIKYKTSYLEALAEFAAEGSDYYANLDPEAVAFNFDKYVEILHSHALGQNLPAGYVPQTLLWLVDGDQYLGQVSIRHELTPQLLHEGGHIGYNIRPSERQKGYGKLALKLALPIARQLGIEQALVTCDVGNTASKKIIEANGGILEDIRDLGPDKPEKMRYWIKTIG